MNAGGNVLEDLKSVETWNLTSVEDPMDKVLFIGLTPKEIVNCGLVRRTERIRDCFNHAEIYLLKALAVSRIIEQILFIMESSISEEKEAHKGTVVTGTIQRDIHNIGKNIFCAILCGAGYKVIDLGAIGSKTFIDVMNEVDANIFGRFALMTTTLTIQGEVVNVVHNNNMFIAIIFGGAPCNQERVNNMGGDGYSSSETEILTSVPKLLYKEEEKQ